MFFYRGSKDGFIIIIIVVIIYLVKKVKIQFGSSEFTDVDLIKVISKDKIVKQIILCKCAKLHIKLIDRFSLAWNYLHIWMGGIRPSKHTTSF